MKRGTYNRVPTQDERFSLELTSLSQQRSPFNPERLCEAIMLSDINEVASQLEKLHGVGSKAGMEDCYNAGVLPRHTTILHIAAKKHVSTYLEQLLEYKLFGDVNTKDDLGYTPLMHAADAGSIENVRFLIGKGADILAESKSRFKGADGGRTENRRSEARIPADYKPDISLQKCLKRTVFHIAAGRGYKDIIEELLNKTCQEDKEDVVNQLDDNGWTPLFWAAQSCDLECFTRVLETERCNKQIKDKSERNIFHIIAENDCHQILKQMFDKCESFETLLTETDNKERTPFMTSVYKGKIETAKLLMKYEKSLGRQDMNGNTVFHLAAERGAFDILQFLLSPQIRKLKTLFNDDKVFLASATHSGTTSADNTLLLQIVNNAQISESDDHHFNNIWYPDELKRRNKDGSNCFHLAAGSGNIHCLHLLNACCITMQQGFISFPLKYLDVKNNSQFTPLHYAISSRSRDVIKFLVTHGADLMSRTKLLPMLPKISDEVSKECASDEVDGGHNAPSNCDHPITCMQRGMRTSLHYILKMPNGASIIKELFNESVAYRNNGDDRDELVVDFQLLICNSGLRMAITHEILRQNSAGIMDVLLHPLLKSFIHTEWMNRKYFPWFRCATYILYLSFLTLYAWLPEDAKITSKVIGFLVSTLSLMIILFCVPYFLPGVNLCERVKGILQTMPPPVLALIAITVGKSAANHLLFLSLAVILSWLSLIFHSSALTSVNQQAAQFQTVLFTMLRNAPVFFIVVFGFTLSFYVLYFEEDNFDNIWNALLYTSVVLLHGGMDDSPYFSRNTTQVAQETLVAEGSISFLFAFVVTLALLNMLVGLAVSSAEELRNEGRIVFMRDQVRLLLKLDQMLKYLHLSTLWRKMHGGKCYPDTIAQDHKMVVNNDNTSLEIQIELRDIAKEQRVKSCRPQNCSRGSLPGGTAAPIQTEHMQPSRN